MTGKVQTLKIASYKFKQNSCCKCASSTLFFIISFDEYQFNDVSMKNMNMFSGNNGTTRDLPVAEIARYSFSRATENRLGVCVIMG